MWIVDVLLGQPAAGDLGDVGVLGRQHAVERLEQQHLGPHARRRPTRSRRPTRRRRRRRSCRAAPRAPMPPRCRSRGRRTRCPGSASASSRWRARSVLASISLPSIAADLDVAVVGRASRRPRCRSILFFLNRPPTPPVERRDDLLAALVDLGEVDRAAGDLDPESPASSISESMSADAQHGLGRDAGVVQAAAADLVLLHHGGLHPELGGADRRHVAAGAGADDDAVVLGFGHGSGEC